MPVNQTADIRTRIGANFSAAYTGPLARLDDYKLELPALKRTVKGKLFIKQFLGLSGMQISMNKLPAGAAVPFYHQHRENEEAYIFLGGSGEMQIDGEVFAVEEGTIVRVSPAGSRTLRNISDSDLYYICVQAKDGSLNSETMEDGIKSADPVIWPS
ncbi:MAG: cupin domain-containing protein [Candidatus Obscuribacterales bacterium]|nr:cupin domain-containing protein [Candidatus Obscuribacterales bacterium]